jgi:hypothetical protein
MPLKICQVVLVNNARINVDFEVIPLWGALRDRRVRLTRACSGVTRGGVLGGLKGFEPRALAGLPDVPPHPGPPDGARAGRWGPLGTLGRMGPVGPTRISRRR